MNNQEKEVSKNVSGLWKIKTLNVTGFKNGTGPIIKYENANPGTVDIIRLSNIKYQLFYSSFTDLKIPRLPNNFNNSETVKYLNISYSQKDNYKGIYNFCLPYYSKEIRQKDFLKIIIIDQTNIKIDWSDTDNKETGTMLLTK